MDALDADAQGVGGHVAQALALVRHRHGDVRDGLAEQAVDDPQAPLLTPSMMVMTHQPVTRPVSDGMAAPRPNAGGAVVSWILLLPAADGNGRRLWLATPVGRAVGPIPPWATWLGGTVRGGDRTRLRIARGRAARGYPPPPLATKNLASCRRQVNNGR